MPLYNSQVETCRRLKNEDLPGERGLNLPRHGLLAWPGAPPIQVLGKQDFTKLPPFAKRQNLGSLPTTHTLKHQPALHLEPSENRIKRTGLCWSSQSLQWRGYPSTFRYTELNGNLFSPGLPGTCLAMLWLNPTSAMYFMSKRERHKFTATPALASNGVWVQEAVPLDSREASTFRSAMVTKMLAW